MSAAGRAPSRSAPRIVAGTLRGRRLSTPEGYAVRPTADRVRQALFDMLAHAPWSRPLPGAAVLDAFAGTGALGFEAFSRGAAWVAFLERDPAALACLRANAAALAVGDAARILAGDALRPPRAERPCDLLFLDPPYAEAIGPAAVEALGRAGWFAPGALLCLEAARGTPAPPGFDALAERSHGAAVLHVLRAP